MVKKKKAPKARSSSPWEHDSLPVILQDVADPPPPLPPPPPPPPEMWSCLEAAMEPLACGKAYYFDSRGDVTFTVGDPDQGTRDFVVCSRTVARWSSVFSAMLFGGFAESRPKSDGWRVLLPEDEVAPVFLAFKLIHGSHENTPKTLERDELYQLLVVTEKYDMTRILRPWAATWFEPYKNTSSIEGNEIVMWIAWELGHEECFRRLAADLLLKSKVNEDGELLDKEGVPLNTYTCLEPPGILESVAQSRGKLIETMTGFLQDVIQGALSKRRCQGGNHYSGGYSYCNRCGSSSIPNTRLSEEQCAAFVFGSLTHVFSGAGLQGLVFPQATEFRYLGSAKKFLTTIEDMHYQITSGHECCNPLPALQEKARNLVKAAPSPVTEQHLEYLRSQAKKTGILGN
ncbi:nuclear pore protein-like protein [Colletotrichum musicola]|uniref:Nuclear pore protein-like protein n=1 Tax=Colletotrichum musicola TaxID=2175873 RepID=A0A8H6NPX7_9PEZI|nr:nuclear pore protein-like protein [Colletotrichum musicola]